MKVNAREHVSRVVSYVVEGRPMITEIRGPRWETLRNLIEGCETKLLICSPWITTRGIEQLETFLAANTRLRSIEIWTRVTEVATDSRNLLRLARALTSRGLQVSIKDSQSLHLKVYLADETAALLGSANLTEPGLFDQRRDNSVLVRYDN